MKVGLALGGGGWRGLAHIGVLKTLQQAHIHVDYLSGTSIGSLIGALWAAGWSAEELEQTALSLSREDLYEGALSPLGLLRWTFRAFRASLGRRLQVRGLVRGDKLDTFLRNWIKQAAVDDLHIPYAAVATDLISSTKVVLTSRAVAERVEDCGDNCLVLTGVDVATSVRASSAIPGVFEPAEVSGHMLVDGGVVDNVPVHFVRKMGADLVVAVDVRKQRATVPSLRSPFSILGEATDIMVNHMSDLVLAADADIVIRPQVPDASRLSPEYAKAVIAAGEEAAREILPVLGLRLALDRPGHLGGTPGLQSP